MVERFLSLTLIVLVAGCSTKQVGWERPGGSQRDFDMDNAECNARAFSAPVNMFGFALIKNQCLQGKGWQLVETEVDPPSPSQAVPSVEIDPRIKQANASYERRVRELCGSERYKTLFANTACFAN